MIHVTIAHPGGLHMRVAATCVDLLSKCVQKPLLGHVYLHYQNHKIPFIDLMAVISLQIRRNDEIDLTLEDGDESLLSPLVDFLSRQDVHPGSPDIDDHIQKAVLTDQAILHNMSYGLIVVNELNQISFVNQSAMNLLHLSNGSAILGRNSTEIIPEAHLELVLQSGRPETAIKHDMNGEVVLTTSCPIRVEGALRGAMTIFQDISEVEKLVEEITVVKKLKEQFHLVLQTVHDGICVLDGEGIVRYVNPAYELLHHVAAEDILGKSIDSLSPTGLRHLVLQTGKPAQGTIMRAQTQSDIIADVNPIYVDNSLHGLVSVTRSLSEVKELLDRVYTLQQETEYLKDELYRKRPFDHAFSSIVGKSGVLMDSLAIANKVAQTSSTVLITGESGTGKELIAKAIHKASARKNNPFIRVNCAGIPVSLIESELFGHERGAFTGAVSLRKGKFELAQNGTIFLDEIGELPLVVQSKLLRVLQEREIERVGGNQPILLNVRVIAATNRTLEQEVFEHKFREDLYYRINVVRIHLPSLRDRAGDIPLLVDHFIRELNLTLGKQVRGCTKEALDCLLEHHFVGNVRELRNVLERALNLCEGEWIFPSDFPPSLFSPSLFTLTTPVHQQSLPTFSAESTDSLLTMEEYERLIIQKALSLYPSFNSAAKALGLTHKTVAAKARKFGLGKRNNLL